MGASLRIRPKISKRVWLIAAAAGCASISIFVTAIASNGFGLGNSEQGTSDARTAQARCESEVFGRLASPSAAKLSDVKATRGVLDPAGQDLFQLKLNAALKEADQSHITVWSVSGVVDAQNAFGATIRDPFSCRAYFIDGILTDTVVLFDHDH